MQAPLIKYLSKPSKFALGFLLLSLLIGSSSQSDGEFFKFKLSAKNLPNMDIDGPSDPYVSIWAATRSNPNRHHRHWQYVGLTSTKTNTLNPEWDEVFQYQFINGTSQMLRFFVRDSDESWINPIYAIDDFLGHVDIGVADYIRQARKLIQQQKESTRGNETGASESETTQTPPLKAIQLFLTHPVGGTLLISPVTDE